ncbi:hypothetical protein [Cognatishimia maritima]|uniref:Uncharacterized protein n=1 Tax=Cognatishimia maritima TaxID=870908 RepID=A0A1M5UX40_9RHOB|nr:hypothetical protein [Cognatishimia maritima]SHH67458.1 hypothetical protein SAMN04488044_2986 [Cognatishimia maritima]
MKKAKLTYSKEFCWGPISGWAGARKFAYSNQSFERGPAVVRHPFLTSSKLWCQLEIEYQNILLLFSMPPELDQFTFVMGMNPLPSGGSLVKGQRLGRPNNHWLSRLPAKAKSRKFRLGLLKYIEESNVVRDFYDFYADKKLLLDVEGFFDTYEEAQRARGIYIQPKH